VTGKNMALKIVKITKNNQLKQTVDIEVETTHSYLLENGAVSHNSVILGTASGIHGEHSPMYIRNVQMNENDEVLQLMQKENPSMVRKSVWSSNGTDYVVGFPIISKEGSIYKSTLMGVKQLDFVKKAQQAWVEAGTNLELCRHPKLRHNVSNTITVDDWAEVEQYLFDNRAFFAGVSLLSAAGDRAYAQAPFTEVFTAQQIMDLYGTGSIMASGLIVDALPIFGSNLWYACDTVLGMGMKLSPDSSEHLLARDWVRRAKKFAENFFEGDVAKMTYCLKDCYNLHKWSEIERTIKPIDFSKELSKQQYVDADTMAAAGCSGGSCEISF
jgi:ribonucleoside-diphosphate reductase alpha chain